MGFGRSEGRRKSLDSGAKIIPSWRGVGSKKTFKIVRRENRNKFNPAQNQMALNSGDKPRPIHILGFSHG